MTASPQLYPIDGGGGGSKTVAVVAAQERTRTTAPRNVLGGGGGRGAGTVLYYFVVTRGQRKNITRRAFLRYPPSSIPSLRHSEERLFDCPVLLCFALLCLTLAQVLSLLARRRLPELVCHFEEIDFSLDMVRVAPKLHSQACWLLLVRNKKHCRVEGSGGRFW